jgi:multidrug efflux pump subunit AcrA (membrane-fusion protein)
MKSRTRGVWHLVLLGLFGAAVVVAAVLEIGPPTSSGRTSREIVTAEKGVVQSTVSGSGNIEPGTEVESNFKTSGTLSNVYVKVGQHVNQGQLLAALDPTSAQLSVDQAQLSLNAAEDQLTAAEDGTSTSSSGANNASTSVEPASTQFVSDSSTAPTTTSTPTTATPTTTTTATTTTTVTAPSTTTPGRSRTKTTGTGGTGSQSSRSGSGSGSSSSASGSPSGTTTTTPSPATIASAQASVDSARLSLRSAQAALDETRLYAPASGTVVSLESTSPGDDISGSSASSASDTGSAGSSGSGSASSGTGTSASSTGSSGSLGSSSSSSSSSSSGFAEIVNTSTMTMTVAFSESDISKVKVGQPATVTLDALTGVELAAHVSSISTLGTTSSGVVSYDATLTLDQNNSQVKPGMSASASVITGQTSGVTLPNSAIAGSGSLSTVNVLRNGKQVATQVVVGLKGDSRTQIVSGLSSGAQVVVTTTLPALGSSATSGSSSSGTLGGGGLGGGGLGGGAGRFGGGGGFGGGRFLGGGGG